MHKLNLNNYAALALASETGVLFVSEFHKTPGDVFRSGKLASTLPDLPTQPEGTSNKDFLSQPWTEISLDEKTRETLKKALSEACKGYLRPHPALNPLLESLGLDS